MPDYAIRIRIAPLFAKMKRFINKDFAGDGDSNVSVEVLNYFGGFEEHSHRGFFLSKSH